MVLKLSTRDPIQKEEKAIMSFGSFFSTVATRTQPPADHLLTGDETTWKKSVECHQKSLERLLSLWLNK
jgi:hypothetical protein